MHNLKGFVVTSTLYEGVNTRVVRAVTIDTDVPVIIKTPADSTPSLQATERYQREYDTLKSIGASRNIVAATALIHQDHIPFLIMADFGGIDLKTLTASHKFDLGQRIDIAAHTANALDEIYQAGIIHKDIKLSNILYNIDNGELKICDFSSATIVSRETPSMDRSILMAATLPYMSPEQTGRMNRLVDWRTDYYSLGVSLYELFTGQLPFQATEPIELVHAHLAQTPKPLHDIVPGLPPVLSDIVAKLMAKDANDRYQTAYGIKADMDACKKRLSPSGDIERFHLFLQDFPERFSLPQKIYGRTREKDKLLAAYARSCQGQKTLFMVTGSPGIGKTALIREIHKPIVETRGLFISGKFDQYQKQIPYSAIIKAIGELIQTLLTQSEAAIIQWKTDIVETLGDIAKVITDVIPELELIIDPQPDIPVLGPTETQNRFQYAFQSFIQVFCKKEHPLVIFLDDLQWADVASLKLIEIIMAHEAADHLLIIGAYRNTEVTETHPLTLTLEQLEKRSINPDQIHLSGIILEDITALIMDAFPQAREDSGPIALLLLDKTRGNPFFVNQFLTVLADEGLIAFDRDQRTWTWDIEAIEEQNITDNVADLMQAEIEKLPHTTQDVLRVAAILGNQFTMSLLSRVTERPLAEITAAMEPALSKGFILIRKYGKEAGDMQYAYSFAHDQIQKAAAALTPEMQRPALHVHIGRILKNELSDDQLDDAIFDIIDHLNHGIDKTGQILEGLDKEELIHLNLMAGKKAKANAAWATGFDYLYTALILLGQNSWGKAYKLALDIHSEIVEAAYLCGRYQYLSIFVHAVFKNAATLIDKERSYTAMIRAFTAEGNLNDAVKIGIQALAEYGVKFPKKPKKIHVILEIIKTKIALSGKTMADLLNLPELVDQEKQALCRLLSYLHMPMYLSSPDMGAIEICKRFQLLLKYGHSPSASWTLVDWGLLLCGPLNDPATGYQFGKLALQFMNRYDNSEFETVTLLLYNGHVQPWGESIHQTFLDKDALLKASLNKGFVELVPMLYATLIVSRLFAGDYLSPLVKDVEKGLAICRQIHQPLSERWLRGLCHFTISLSEHTSEPFPIKAISFYDVLEQPAYLRIKDYLGYSNSLIFIIWCCYLSAEYELAIEYIKKILPYKDAIGASSLLSYLYFYGSLSLLAVYPDKTWNEQVKIRLRVFLNQKWLKKRADLAPENFLNKYHLVEAEHYRIEGKDTKAAEFYDKAIDGARTNRFIHEEAMANEVAAKFYAGRKDMAKARSHMGRAKHCYTQWGAMAKVGHLEETFPELLSEDIPVDRRTTLGMTTTQPINESQLDLTSVIKASQVISGEIEIKKLLSRVMDIIIENAGAQKGYLILKSAEDDRFCIEAQGHIDGKDSQVPESIPIANSGLVPESIIHYVARIKESLVIADATDHKEFATDSYIMENRPKSVLCAPLIHRNKISGIVYLENNLTPGTFTKERVEIISLLCSQASISLENAGMYQQQQAYAQTLEEKVAERTAELNQSLDTIKKTQDQLVQSEKMAALGSLVAGVAHEVNTPIGVAVSAASHLEDMTSAFVKKIESSQVKRSDLDNYTKTASTASTLILKNLTGAVKIVQGFKQVAVDQTSGERREFKLKAYIEDVLLSLQPKLKKTKHAIRVDCPDDLLLNSFPGAFSQIISNLVMNSLLHGFEGIETGEIIFEVRRENNDVLFIYKDNGKGMTDKTLARIFDPFFTTKRSQGGSGLGMHIVHNLVTRTLGGKIACESQPDRGTTLTIQIPMTGNTLVL